MIHNMYIYIYIQVFPIGYALLGSPSWVYFLLATIGVGTHQDIIQSPKRQYKAPKHYTKPQQSIQSPDRLYKAPRDFTKPQEGYTKT